MLMKWPWMTNEENESNNKCMCARKMCHLLKRIFTLQATIFTFCAHTYYTICWFACGVLVNSTFATEHVIKWRKNELLPNCASMQMFTQEMEWDGRIANENWDGERDVYMMGYSTFHLEIYAPLSFSRHFFIRTHTHTHIIYGVELLIGVLMSNSMYICMCLPRAGPVLEYNTSLHTV